MRRISLALLLVSAFAASACSDAQPTIEVTPSASLPGGFVLKAAPTDAVAVSATKTSAKEGDTVTVRGRIGGKAKPMIQGRAAFLLADTETITACDDRPGDPCEIPWDYCCEDVAKITESTITVQVVDDDGRALAIDLATSIPGVEPGAFVVIQGTVGPRPNEDILIVNATGLFVTSK